MSTAPANTGTDVTTKLFQAFIWIAACLFFVALAFASAIFASVWWKHFPNGPPLHIYGGLSGVIGFLFLAVVAARNALRSISSAFD